LAADHGYHFTFRFAAFVALIGAAVVWWGLERGPHEEPEISQAAKPSRSAQLGMLVREPHLFAASLGYGLITLMFGAAVVNFFPLYATALAIDQATIGSIFAVRALASTLVRMPVGLMTTRISTRTLMVAALALGMASLFMIPGTGNRTLLTILLAGEGICFGAFLTAGQAFIAEQFTASERGAAMGVYGVAGSVGLAFGPLALGPIADYWGITTVFSLTGVLVLMGIVVLVWTGRQAREQGVEG
jgi:MFS family permease